MKHAIAVLCLLAATAAASVQAQTQDPATPQWRPAYHFTPEKNWTNDPNGLIWLDGQYLAYNQQNPFENKWGHMSWGHATSKDLLHWKHLPVAIPEIIDEAKHDTLWIFSGSAVWDEHNTSGFCKEKGCLVAIYTGHQPDLHKESQWIAYSNDGGRSFTNYDKDPVIDLHKQDFRDPNVFWYEPQKKWIMTVSLPAEHKVRFYGSQNLKEWALLSEFGPQGYTEAYWECPSLMELPVEGGGSHWVLMNSAAGGPRGVYMQYFTGNFDGTTFTNDDTTTSIKTVDEGDCFYAAIPFNNVPGDKKILVGWMIPGTQHTEPWTGQFSIPRDLKLVRTADGYRLLQTPAKTLDQSLPHPTMLSNVSVADTKTPIEAAAKADNAYWLDVELEPGTAKSIEFGIGRSTQGAASAIIDYDAQKQVLNIARTRRSAAPAKMRQTIKLAPAAAGTDGSASTAKLRLHILFDRSSLEVFTGSGEHVITDYVYPEKGATGCDIQAKGGTAVIKQLKIYDLSK
jgi:fructan beta-fructosidase